MHLEENAVGNARRGATGEAVAVDGAEYFQCLAHRQDGLAGKQFAVHGQQGGIQLAAIALEGVGPVILPGVRIQAVDDAGFVNDKHQPVGNGHGGHRRIQFVVIPDFAAPGDVAGLGRIDANQVSPAVLAAMNRIAADRHVNPVAVKDRRGDDIAGMLLAVARGAVRIKRRISCIPAAGNRTTRSSSGSARPAL